MDPETLKLLGGGGSLAALLALIYVVGMRLVRAIDRLVGKIDDHTKVDVQYHNEVQLELAALGARIDTALDLTPVRTPRHKTNPRGVPTGSGYRPPRPGTRDDGDD